MIKKPILWSGESQMSGDTIQLYNNLKSNKLDSLRVHYNTFLVQKDSIEGYNQVKGKELIGLFNDNNKLYRVDINKNAEHLQYTRKENGEMIGINKIVSAKINILFEDNQMNEITYIADPSGNLTPDSQYPKNARKLRGFEWRGDERILSVEDLFKEDPPLVLPIIKGIEERILDEDDIETLRSIEKPKQEKKPIAKKLNTQKPTLQAPKKQSKKERRDPRLLKKRLLKEKKKK